MAVCLIKSSLSVACVLLLLGCATTRPEIRLTADPVVIEASELSQYWVQERKNTRFNISPNYVPEPGQRVDGYVKIKYLIDSNGRIFNPEIVESVPEGAWDYSAVKALSKQKYRPAEQNTAATPVSVTLKIDVKT